MCKRIDNFKMDFTGSSDNNKIYLENRQKEKDEEKTAANEKLKKEINRNKSNSNIPARYVASKFVGVSKEQIILAERLLNNFRNKKSNEVSDMLINGTIGTGKTHLVIGFLNKLLNMNIECKYITEHGLLELYFRKDYTAFDTFKKSKILVIDELAKRELIDWQMIQIEELLSYRYNEQLPTILITNADTNSFKKFLGSRLSDRLRDNNIIIVTLTGESLRGKQL